MLGKLMNNYNNKKLSTIKMAPIEASSKKNEVEVYRNINKPLLFETVIQFKVGGTVRISRLKGIFEKGYLPNWSEEIFTVDQIKDTIPVTYILRDTSLKLLMAVL